MNNLLYIPDTCDEHSLALRLSGIRNCLMKTNSVNAIKDLTDAKLMRLYEHGLTVFE